MTYVVSFWRCSFRKVSREPQYRQSASPFLNGRVANRPLPAPWMVEGCTTSPVGGCALAHGELGTAAACLW
eukprot:scaffold2270_cov362-Prasinococcus_capsulatus_cf.AAC.2